MGSFNFYQFPILIFQPILYNLQDCLSNSCVPCSFQIPFSCSPDWRQYSCPISYKKCFPAISNYLPDTTWLCFKKEGCNTACDSVMQEVLSHPIFLFPSETQMAPKKRYLDFKIWALKFSKIYIPFWQLERSMLSKTISVCLQHVTATPSNQDLAGTEITQSAAENIQCAYAAVQTAFP